MSEWRGVDVENELAERSGCRASGVYVDNI